MIALTHLPSPRMQECERTYVPQGSINYATVVRQHEGYCRCLTRWGLDVRRLDVNLDCPDSTFVEDTAVVLDEIAVLARMGALSRRDEPRGMLAELSQYRRVCCLEPPAMLEGGDVLRIGPQLLVGLSSRTNREGVEMLRRIVEPYGYEVQAIPVRHSLHLKTACTALPDDRLLVNPAWIDRTGLAAFNLLEIDPSEPWAANTLSVRQQVLMPASSKRTADLVRQRGFDVEQVDVSEFAKAEGGVTCLSLLLEP